MADGKTRKTIAADLVKGNILRTVNQDGSVPPFGDSVIIEVKGSEVFFARPMVWAGGKHRVELFSTTVERVLDCNFFHTVLAARGGPYSMI